MRTKEVEVEIDSNFRAATKHASRAASIGYFPSAPTFESGDPTQLRSPSVERAMPRDRQCCGPPPPPSSSVKMEEHAAASSSTLSLDAPRRMPAYLPSTTDKPASLPRAYLNGTQDMLQLFGLMPIYDRAVRPYNPDTIKAEAAAAAATEAPAEASTSKASNARSGAASTRIPTVAAAGAASSPAPGVASAASATPSGSIRPATGSNSAVAGMQNPPSHPSSGTGRISTPALQLNGGASTFALHTDSSAILAASPGQIAASAAAAPPARRLTKPPPTYAHYVDDLAGRVRPPRKGTKAARTQKGDSLLSILFKPEYTPQRIVPLDRETMSAAFTVQPGPVAEIDHALLEPDDEEAPRPRKKKKKLKQEQSATMHASSGPPSAARTPSRR